jgi:phenylacetate-coenzyme A ligase PaaK-like adenylate-forming protein
MNRCIKKAKLLLAKWYLQNTPTSKMLKQSERAAKALFFNDYGQTDTLKGSFSNQKTSNKASVFTDDFIGDVIQKNKANIASVMISSGSTGAYSLGLITHNELKKAPLATDFFLNLVLGAHPNNTFIINALSMGVRVFSHFATSDTGPRTDLVIALLKMVSPYYEKTIVVGDVLFIKQLAEESVAAGVNWSKLKCWFVSGGDWMPETLRTYVHELTNKSPFEADKGFWLGEYGVSEISYPLFFETEELVKIRANLKFKSSPEKDTHPKHTTPFVFHYLPASYFVETQPYGKGFSELVFSTLNQRRLIKLQRYASGDWGELLGNEFSDKVTLQLPLVRFWGRLNNFVQVGNRTVHVSDIKELLFEDHGLASLVTGYFSLYVKNEHVQLDVQLKNGAASNTFEARLFIEQIGLLYKGLVKVEFLPFYEMNKFLSLDFERKFNPLKF